VHKFLSHSAPRTLHADRAGAINGQMCESPRATRNPEISRSLSTAGIICTGRDDSRHPRHPRVPERRFECRHLIRVRLSRVSRTLQPLTLRQFPLVTFKILRDRPSSLPLLFRHRLSLLLFLLLPIPSPPPPCHSDPPPP